MRAWVSFLALSVPADTNWCSCWRWESVSSTTHFFFIVGILDGRAHPSPSFKDTRITWIYQIDADGALASYHYEPPADTVRELQAIVEVARRELG